MTGLFDSTVLEVAIGLIFVYLLLAILCTALNEWVARILKTRAKMLEKGIRQLLDSQATQDAPKGDGNQFFDSFTKHPLIVGMRRGGNGNDDKNPSYLSARTFSTVVMDIATVGKKGAKTVDDLRAAMEKLPDGDVKTALLAITQNVTADVASAQKAIEEWFDDTMDRVSGWYKRNMQTWTIVFAIIVTILSNADTVRITRQLWLDPVVREKIVESAKSRAAQQSQESSAVTATEMEELGNLLGGPYFPTQQNESETRWWLKHVLGLALTAIAVSLGAPFWFDILKRLMNLRSAGKSPDEQKKTAEQGSTSS